MRKAAFMKRLLLLLMAFTLVMTVAPAVWAQDDHGEGDAAAETTDAVGDVETHGEDVGLEEGGLLTPLGINGGLLFVQVFNFILMAFILAAVLWRPAVNFLDSRSAKIQKGLEDAAAAAKARQNAEQEAEKILAEARQEASKIIDDARSRGDDVASGLEKAARQEADRIRKEAEEDAVAARNAELARLRDQVVNISVALAGRILDEEIDAGKQSQLVSDFLTNLPQQAKDLSGEIEVISAMPLSDDEKNRVSSELNADNVNYAVDPAILGGLIVRSSARVVDGSVRGGLADLSERLS